jgi:hypothetical protein
MSEQDGSASGIIGEITDRLVLIQASAEGKARGYTGERCSECGNFALLRSGACHRCNVCGSTTGCS